MLKTMTAALLGTALLVAPALAQNNTMKPNTQAPAAQSNTAMQDGQRASAQGLWRSSKLIGLNVYNNQNEKIGDIKELMLGKDGQIDQVVIGVGGFLGLGAHDVAVKFSELKWSDQPVRNSTASNNTTAPRTGTATTGSATAPAGSTAGTATTAASNDRDRTYPDHAMLNATKDQLKAMPEFKYSQ